MEETLPLRQAVLWPTKSIDEVRLEEDDHGWHFGAFLDPQGDAVAVISLFLEDLPFDLPKVEKDNHSGMTKEVTTVSARFRKFATDPGYQGKGIGTRLLAHMFSFARSDLHANVVWCDARVSSSRWYRKRGMIASGGNFYKGDVEYVRMSASLE